MPPKNSNKDLKTKVKESIEKCLLMSEEEKQYWLSKIDELPVPTLENVLRIIQNKNAIIDGYITQAIAADPEGEYLKTLKIKVKKIKKQAFNIEEKAENVEQEEQLDELLKKI